MAHKVVGIDLGGHSVKAVVLRIALRGHEVVRIDEEPVVLDESGRSTPSDVLAAAGRLVDRLALQDETLHCALPGDQCTVHRISLPTSAAKQLESALRFELDDALPFDIEDAVFSHVELGRDGGDVKVLAAVALKEHIRELIDGLRGHNVDPREIGIASLCYTQDVLPERATGPGEVAAVLDIGHLRSVISVLEPNSPTVRTLLRGGRDLTEAIDAKWKVGFLKAEQYKFGHGLSGEVGEVLTQALRPLVREVRQTLKGHQAAGGERVTKVYLTGGGALLKGLDNFLTDEVGVPVQRLRVPLPGDLEDSPRAYTFALPFATALRETTPRSKRMNLRRGEFAFKGDFENLRRRVGWIAASVVAIVLSWVFSIYAHHSVLAAQVEKQSKEIAEQSQALFGEPVTSLEEVKKRLEGQKTEKPPMPTKDAFDVVLALSRMIPVSVVHDVESLEIKPKRTTIKGLVNPEVSRDLSEGDTGGGETDFDATQLSPTDLIKAELEKFKECFTSIRVGKVTVMGEKRRYQMDIDTKCP
ncbi:MAG: type II secretion system protein GspL [Myxococcota bacterium]|nr:type II secretion system protein GspL [Myxococcota bacterium]